jgi:hypothetical protein
MEHINPRVSKSVHFDTILKLSEYKKHMRDVFPVKYYKDEGFVERKLEIDDDDLIEIIEDYLMRHTDFDFDEVEIENMRPMNIWLHAKCRKYLDPDLPEDDQNDDAEVLVSGKYDGNSSGGF